MRIMSLSVRVAATSLKLVLEGHLILGVRAIPTRRSRHPYSASEPFILGVRATHTCEYRPDFTLLSAFRKFAAGHPLAPTYRRGYDANVGERTQHPEVLSIRRNTAALAPYLRISLTSEEMSNNIQDISPSILAGA